MAPDSKTEPAALTAVDRSAATPLLFLIADTGGGHRASATAVRSYLEAHHPGRFDIHLVDPFVELAPGFTGRTTNLYGPIIKHAPWMWGAVYHTTNSRAAVAMLRGSGLRTVKPGIARLCRRLDPAAIVSFHPLLNHVTARVLRRPDVRRVPLITVITDLVDVHAAWACRDVDAVVTPSIGGLDRARRAGIPATRCFQLGLPVHDSFTGPPLTQKERHQLRQRLGLDPDRFTVLVCSGADGGGGLVGRAAGLAAAPLDIQLVVVCGRNAHAQSRLSGLQDHRGREIMVRGFVDNMADWIRASDIVVTKAGPGTIAETLCTGTPMLLNWYVPGQERGNVEWLIDVGAGRYVPHTAQLINTVAELAQPGSAALASMREAVARVARPDATRDISNLIVTFVDRAAR